jgi:hypothetical protein
MNKTLSFLCSVAAVWTATGCFALGAESTNWVTVFDEQFADNPIQRFKILPVTESPGSEGTAQYDEERHAYSVGGHLALVRPVRAGVHVVWDLTLRFEPPGTNALAEMKTALRFVLFDRSMAGIEIQRSTNREVPSSVRFIQDKPGQREANVLREIRMPGAAPDGSWQLSYRHGLLTLRQGSNTVGSADLEVLGVPVAGVSWTQKGGKVACQRMTLSGEPFQEARPEDQETLERAARLNEEAQRLFREKKADQALPKMKEASALFVQIHGENHHDSANSFVNIATMLETGGNQDEAAKLWAKALSIHEKTLGPTHPHTTLTRFNQGTYFMQRGEKAKARELWTRCRDDWRAVLGPDYMLVKSLDALLLKL